ncbi:hypothetical protein ACTFIY_003719 [Dictyostelium cf. discoideum]
MDRIDNWLNEKYFGYSMIEKLRNTDDTNSEELRLSCGEITSSYCSGLIDFENACYILYNRSILQKKTIKLSLNNNNENNINNNNNNNNIYNCIYNINKFENGLCKIDITEKEFNEIYSKKYENVEIAFYCDDNSIMVGGKINDLLKLSNEISNSGIFTKMIPVPTSFHTSSQDIVKNEIMNLKFNYFKTPVKYNQSIKSLFNHVENNNLGEKVVFIEISPTTVLIMF